MRKIIFLLFLVLVFGSLGYYFRNNLKSENLLNRTADIFEVVSDDGQRQGEEAGRLSVSASNLQIPWGLVFLPGGEILFTERAGRVRLIDRDGNLIMSPVATISEVSHIGEGGLLGIEIHPDFGNNGFVYLYYTYGKTGGNTLNRVARFKFDGKNLSDQKIILDGIAGASNHNGGRLKFGPDGFLYITTGDGLQPSLSQNRQSLAGKILRVTDDGMPAPGNPFGNEVYSYGHRNPQGITWDESGRLWSTEHGSSAKDELNRIEMGKNYGWPEIQGNEEREGMVSPQINSGSLTWAPSGAVFYNGSIFFAGLRGESLFEYEIESGRLTRYLNGELGRIRDVVLGPDGLLYIATSNQDGRGVPSSDDDKIIRVNPDKL